METTAADLPIEVPAKKGKGGRKALKQKNEANILPAGDDPSLQAKTSSLPSDSEPHKENHESLSLPQSEKKKPRAGKSKPKAAVAKSANANTDSSDSGFEKDMSELQEMLEKMKIEKEKTEELLKEKDEMLKMKDEELENKGKEQEKLQIELKKLQKMKEFKPTVGLELYASLVEKDLDKKDKKKGGPEKIKKPAPAYVLWCKDQWNEVKKTNPDADFKEMSNILGAKWKTITPEEKKPYEEKYQTEREAYLLVASKEKRENEAMKLLEEDHKQKTAMELLEQYLQFKQEADKDKKTKKEKDPLKPKHPLSSFFLFSNERRADLLGDGKSILEASKITGEEWNNMTDEQKKPYEELAKEKKEKYLQEMEVYKQKKEEEEADMKKEEEEHMKLQKLEALQMLKKKEKTENIIKKAKDTQKKQKEVKITDPNKPKRPLSSYFMFSKEARKNVLEERPGINNKTTTALISVKWKELGDEEKQIWNKKAAEAMEAYKKELEEYNKTVADEEKSK